MNFNLQPMNSPDIVTIGTLKTVCMSSITSLTKNQVRFLWKSFMKRKDEILHRSNENFLSIQVYPDNFDMADFTPHTEYRTHAAVEVSEVSSIPEGMHMCIIPEGLYAVFEHRGASNEFHKTATYIFGKWLPKSGFILDNRPHFEVLDERYLGPDNPDSIENVYIPIIKK